MQYLFLYGSNVLCLKIRLAARKSISKRSQHYVKIPALPVQWDGNDSRRCDHYRRKGFCCLSAQSADMRLGDPILTARILLKGPNRRWGSTSVTGRLSWLEHNGHRVASPRPQHASKRHSGTYVGGSQLGSICHSAKPTTWPHRLMATAVVAVAQLPINGGLPTLPLAMHCHRPGRNHRPDRLAGRSDSRLSIRSVY